MMNDYSTIVSLAAAVTTLGGAWLTIRKIAKDAHKAKQEQAAEILHAAKEADAELKLKLESKIRALESDMNNFKESVDKDLAHIKETYTSEIKNLGEKIEDLRTELRQQHAGMLDLLTRLVGKR